MKKTLDLPGLKIYMPVEECRPEAKPEDSKKT